MDIGTIIFFGIVVVVLGYLIVTHRIDIGKLHNKLDDALASLKPKPSVTATEAPAPAAPAPATPAPVALASPATSIIAPAPPVLPAPNAPTATPAPPTQPQDFSPAPPPVSDADLPANWDSMSAEAKIAWIFAHKPGADGLRDSLSLAPYEPWRRLGGQQGLATGQTIRYDIGVVGGRVAGFDFVGKVRVTIGKMALQILQSHVDVVDDKGYKWGSGGFGQSGDGYVEGTDIPPGTHLYADVTCTGIPGWASIQCTFG